MPDTRVKISRILLPVPLLRLLFGRPTPPRLSSEASDLTDTLVRWTVTEERRFRRFLGYSSLAVLLLCIPVYLRFSPGTEGNWLERIFGGLFFVGVVGLFTVIGWCILCSTIRDNYHRHKGWKRQALYSLAEMNDPRYVGPLLEIVTLVDRSVVGDEAYEGVRDALARIVTRVKSREELSLTRDQMNSLFDVLHSYSDFVLRDGDEEHKSEPKGYPRSAFDQSLSLACLRAYQFVNDPRALEQVRKLAERMPTHAQVVAWRVVDKAREILPDLEQRVRQEQNAGKDALLHPIDEPPSGSALLRPSIGATESEVSSTLLRSGEGRME